MRCLPALIISKAGLLATWVSLTSRKFELFYVYALRESIELQKTIKISDSKP